MRLGIGSYTYTWAIGVPGHKPKRSMTAERLLEEAVRLKVKVVQFCDNLPLDRLGNRELSVCATFARKHDIQIELGTRGTGPAQLRRFLALASRFDCNFLRVVVQDRNGGFNQQRIMRDLVEVLPDFKAAGIKLALENYDGASLPELVRLVGKLGTNHAGICLDTVNSLAYAGGWRAVVNLLAPYALNLHAKDFTFSRMPSQMGFVVEGCAVGAGTLDVPWLLERLRSHRRDVNVIVELWTPRCGSLAKTLALERSLAEASVAYLRKHIPL